MCCGLMPVSNRPLSWSPGFSFQLDPTWSYANTDWDLIAAALASEDGPSGAKLAALRPWITQAARYYRGRADSERARPTSSAVRAEIEALDRSIADFTARVDELSEPTVQALNDRGMELDGKIVMPALREAVRALQGVQSTIGAAADTPAAKGRPVTDARRWFVLNLAEIWSDCHDKKWPTRRHSYKRLGERGQFHRFVEACLMPIDSKCEGLDDDIRAAIAMGKNRRADG